MARAPRGDAAECRRAATALLRLKPGNPEALDYLARLADLDSAAAER